MFRARRLQLFVVVNDEVWTVNTKCEVRSPSSEGSDATRFRSNGHNYYTWLAVRLVSVATPLRKLHAACAAVAQGSGTRAVPHSYAWLGKALARLRA